MKNCKICQNDKPLEDFYKNRRCCIYCYNRASKDSYILKKTEYKEKHAEWRANNTDYFRKYRENNPEKRSEASKKHRYGSLTRRKLYDPIFKIKCNVSSRLSFLVKKAKTNKPCRLMKALGCNLDKLREHLESKFQEGMTWANYGKWHVDHIRPLCNFNLAIEEEYMEVNNYKNLQPLWAEENFSKGGKT